MAAENYTFWPKHVAYMCNGLLNLGVENFEL